MRYLKIYAQDDYDNEVIDAVYFEFYDKPDSKPRHEALAFALAEEDNGKLKWLIADDINNDGIADRVDEKMACEFAKLFLQFKWYSLHKPIDKYMEVLAGDLNADGIPETVRLRFYQSECQLAKEVVLYLTSVSGCDTGTSSSQKDVDEVEVFCQYYLKFGWYSACVVKTV